MKQMLNPQAPISVVKRIANITAIVAAFPLILLAEWIPDLLPLSPNLAHSSDPMVNSVIFPIVVGMLASVGFVSWILLRRLHWSGVWTFAAFWLALVSVVLYLALRKSPLEPRQLFGLIWLLAVALILGRALVKNWDLALRSNNSPKSDVVRPRALG